MEKKSKPSKGRFTIPSVDDILEAEKICSQSEPSLFKRSRSKAEARTKSDLSSQSNEPGLYSISKQQGSSASREHWSGGETSSSKDPVHSSVKASVEQTGESSKVKPVDGGTSSTSAVPRKPCNPRAVIANIIQKNNSVMKHIRNVPWEFGDIVPDFELGRTVCALFLSVRYHALHPDYIHNRLKELGKQYELRILLVLVDTSESHHTLQELAKICLLADLTLILAWSPEEAGRYLETYKAYENKPPDLIMERTDSDFSSRVIDSLTTVKKVNKTDAATLVNNFKTMEKLIQASKDELTLCPGLGLQKAQRLYDLFNEPFLRTKKPKTDT